MNTRRIATARGGRWKDMQVQQNLNVHRQRRPPGRSGEQYVETARKFPQFINIRLAATWRRNYIAGFQCLYGHSQPTFSRPTSNGPRGPIHATVLTVWREKPLLNLREDFMEPLFGTFSSILIVANVSLQLRYTILSRFKLVGKLLSQIEGMFAVFFSHAGGFVKQVQNSPPGGIKLINVVGNRAFRGRCKWDHRL
jgi:hypothetical protein